MSVVVNRLRTLVAQREILYVFTWRDIVIKYKQSVMGFLWAILMPLVIVAAGALVRAALAFLQGRQLVLAEVATVSLKAVPWAFVMSGIRFSTNSLSSNVNLVTKIYLPREIFPLAAVGSQLVDFCVAAVPLTIILAVAGVGVSVQLLWIPVFIVILVAQVAGLGILLSAGSLFFRDVKYLVEVALTFAIFFTPVLFEARDFGRWRSWIMINPVAPVFEGLAETVVHHRPPDLQWLAYSGGVAVVTLIVALAFFARVEPYFAESV